MHGETVAAPPHRLHQPIMPGRLERAAQAADVHIDGTLLDKDMVAPDLVE